MAESLFTSQTPASPDASDGDQYALGSYIVPAVDGVVTHIRWYFPQSAQPGGVDVVGALFRVSDQVKIGADATFVAPTLGAWNTVALAAPVPVAAGVEVCPTVWTPGRYVASSGGSSPWPITNGNLSTTNPSPGRFLVSTGGTPVFPTSAFGNGCYFVDLVFEADGDPAEGTVALGLDLAVAAAGGRRSAGSSALGLNLAVSATGSNGDSVRPITSYPWTPETISTYPWTPRPVESF